MTHPRDLTARTFLVRADGQTAAQLLATARERAEAEGLKVWPGLSWSIEDRRIDGDGWLAVTVTVSLQREAVGS